MSTDFVFSHIHFMTDALQNILLLLLLLLLR